MIINTKTPLGGATYPFLHRLGKKWFLHSWDIDDESPQTYDAPKALRWVNGNHVNDLYVEGMTTQEVLAQTGLQLNMNKGGFVLSKRLSRLMRPYFMYAFFDKNDISVTYLDPPDPSIINYNSHPDLALDGDSRPHPHDPKVWDGAGRVRRSVLLRVLEQMPPLSSAKHKEIAYELHHAKRIEFTLMGCGDWSADKAGGQDKGHCIVFEDDELDADFILPQDTKGEVLLKDGSVFIGFYPVHHADTMRLDIQSLINLWGFFTHDDLMKWLHLEGEMFLKNVREGDVTRTMARIDQTDVDDDDEALEAITNWHVREYVASGGNPMWFGPIAKGLLNQHLKRLNYTTLNKFRLPIPGARYYVMCDEIGKFEIPSGRIRLDPESSTAWVNAEDWVDYIADVLGGADQDDALWVFPFDDYGLFQFLIWRSPNQLGEYVILELTEDSEYLYWETAERSFEFIPMDSNALPPRIDTLNPNYLGLVNPDTAGGLGEWLTEYSIEGMDFTIRRAQQNRGALGQYCNALMLSKALYNSLPSQPPAALEDVIDGSVKTGTDLQAIKEWCYKASRLIVETRKPVPVRLQDRLSLENDANGIPLVPESSRDHWFDRLVSGIEDHINYIQTERDLIMSQTMPPIDVFNVAYQSPDTLAEGARLNQIYTACLPWAKNRKRRGQQVSIEDSLAQARRETTHYIKQISQEDERFEYALLLAAVAHYYSNPEHIGRDEAVWQFGAKNPHTGTRENGIAQQMIQALRMAGVLNELSRLENGRVVRYPSAKTLLTPQSPIKIVGVWFNYWRYTCKDKGQPIPERMQAVDKVDMDWAKEEVAKLAHTQFRNMTLEIRLEGERAIAYTQHNNIFGYIAKEHTHDVTPGKTQLRFCLPKKDYFWAILT